MKDDDHTCRARCQCRKTTSLFRLFLSVLTHSMSWHSVQQSKIERWQSCDVIASMYWFVSGRLVSMKANIRREIQNQNVIIIDVSLGAKLCPIASQCRLPWKRSWREREAEISLKRVARNIGLRKAARSKYTDNNSSTDRKVKYCLLRERIKVGPWCRGATGSLLHIKTALRENWKERPTL